MDRRNIVMLKGVGSIVVKFALIAYSQYVSVPSSGGGKALYLAVALVGIVVWWKLFFGFLREAFTVPAQPAA